MGNFKSLCSHALEPSGLLSSHLWTSVYIQQGLTHAAQDRQMTKSQLHFRPSKVILMSLSLEKNLRRTSLA